MAVMTTESLDKPSLEPKTQPVPSVTTVAMDSDINGGSNEYDALFEDSTAPRSEAAPTDSLANAHSTTNGHSAINGIKAPADPASAVAVSGNAAAPSLFPIKASAAEALLGSSSPLPPAPAPQAVEAPASGAMADGGAALQVSESQVATPPRSTAGITGAERKTQAEPSAADAGDAMDTSEDAAAAAPAPARTADAARRPGASAPGALEMSGASEPFAAAQPSTPPPASAGPPGHGDHEMAEAPSLGKVREREEDDEEENEHLAKRTKTGLSGMPAEFKVPELPATADASVGNGPRAPAQAGRTPPARPAASSPPPSEPTSWDSSSMAKPQHKFLLDKLRQAKKVKASGPFHLPVDPIALNIPTYRDIIKQPMDMSTIEQKLKDDKYGSVDGFMADWKLMINNSHAFNGPGHPVTVSGQNLHAYWLKVMQQLPKAGAPEPAAPVKKAKRLAPPREKPAPRPREPRAAGTARSPQSTAAPPTYALQPDGVPLIRRDSTTTDGRPKREIHRPPPRDLPYSHAKPKKKKYQVELKFCETIVQEMNKAKHQKFSYPFLQPVDPVALNIPTYHKIIKKPMDLGTITQNLKHGNYQNAKEFHSDMMLMFNNCYKFNPETDAVNQMGKLFQALFETLWERKQQWVDEHTPASEPHSPDPEESEEEESEEEIDEAQERLLRIQEQMEKLNREAYELVSQQRQKRVSPKAKIKKSHKETKSTAKNKRAAAASKAAVKPKKKHPPLTFEQKQEISETIQTLNDQDMRKAVQIIRNGVPSLRDVNDDEMELDIDMVPDEVLHELYSFMKKTRPKPVQDDEYEPPRPAPKASSNSMRPKKNKPMNKAEQEASIARIREQLNSFQQGGSGSDHSPIELRAVESSDDEDSPSESEEE